MVYLRDHAGDGMFIGQWVDECIAFLSFVQMTDQQLQNPDYHRLFELFFNKFDKQARFDYGAFYTPKLLAEFVVRFVGKVVADHFDGATIYDDGNTIIDPCCGTGSFLEQIVAHDEGDGAYNLCGFEILPAPYMLANYRMSLVEQHYRKQNLHPSIILANTLSNYLLNDDANARSIEGQELIRAKELSSRPLKLIIGNPPSSDSNRSNVSEEFSQIIDLMEDFRPPVENRRGRQNIQKQINNPFVQFLRWSCEKLLASDNHSVLALIVPLSFLEAESYKYARKYLVEHFSNVWAIAIDTDARTGIRGDSIFMTMQGRAIIVLTRKYGEDNNASEINYADISRERRSEKEAILNGSIEETMRRFITFPISDAMLIDKIAEEHRHKSRYSTGEAIGRASKSRGRATTCAANDKTVTNISSDCTSHQEKDTAGSTHGKIPVKGGRIAAAIPPDAEHRYKINRNNNDDRSQHSDFLSFLHHAEAQ